MLEPFRIAFHNMAPPFGADDLARDNALELERLLGRSIACSVTVEKRHRQNSRGNLFHIAIELLVSNRSFVFHRDPPDGHTHEGLHTAIADAFHVTCRQLQKDNFPASPRKFRGAESEAARLRNPLPGTIRRSHSYAVPPQVDHGGDR